MTRKDYIAFSEIIGRAFHVADGMDDSEAAQELVYDHVYLPIADLFENNNPLFDRTRFSFACASVRSNAKGS
jgi:hypothetical protein